MNTWKFVQEFLPNFENSQVAKEIEMIEKIQSHDFDYDTPTDEYFEEKFEGYWDNPEIENRLNELSLVAYQLATEAFLKKSRPEGKKRLFFTYEPLFSMAGTVGTSWQVKVYEFVDCRPIHHCMIDIEPCNNSAHVCEIIKRHMRKEGDDPDQYHFTHL